MAELIPAPYKAEIFPIFQQQIIVDWLEWGWRNRECYRYVKANMPLYERRACELLYGNMPDYSEMPVQP